MRMNRVQNGIWSGILATGLMTVAMMRIRRRFPASEKEALPPAKLTRDIAEKTGVAPALSRARRRDATFVAHYGYGAFCGALYALFAGKTKHPVARGMAYGMGVWSISYLAGLPALRLRPSAYAQSWRENAMMIAAHLVWGSTLGFAEREFRREGDMLEG